MHYLDAYLRRKSSHTIFEAIEQMLHQAAI
jgi:hypothetical protein